MCGWTKVWLGRLVATVDGCVWNWEYPQWMAILMGEMLNQSIWTLGVLCRPYTTKTLWFQNLWITFLDPDQIFALTDDTEEPGDLWNMSTLSQQILFQTHVKHVFLSSRCSTSRGELYWLFSPWYWETCSLSSLSWWTSSYSTRQNYGKKNVSIDRRRLSMIEKLRTFFFSHNYCFHNYFFSIILSVTVCPSIRNLNAF